MLDLKKYLEAGYVAQCHCLVAEGSKWVEHELEMPTRLAADNCTIEVEIAPGLWTASGYYWEENTLFKKED